MLVNLLVLSFVIALAILFGWLSYRAARARGRWIKIVGVLGAGLFTLIFAAVSVVGALGLSKMYATTGLPAPDLQVAGTPEQVARGKYIASLGCVGCHGVNEQFPLAGGTNLAGEIPMPIGSIVSANLTPGGVLKDRTDGELFRAIRQGYGKDGRQLAFMSQLSYRRLSDDDIQAVIAFLRSQAPATTGRTDGDHINLLGAVVFYGAGMLPPVEPISGVITAPARGRTAEYGSYVATLADCRGCHGPQMTGTPSGPTGPGAPNPRLFVAGWTEAQFVQTLRTGARPDGSRLGAGMPWQAAAQMTDDDLAALYVYLKAPAP